MPSPTKKQTKAELRVDEEPMEVDSSSSPSKVANPPSTPKPKKNAQPKISTFFGSAAKVKKEVKEEKDGDDGKSVSSGLKSPKKEPSSPQKSPKKNTEEKKNEKKEKKKEKTQAKKVVRVKREPKEEEEKEEKKKEEEEKEEKKKEEEEKEEEEKEEDEKEEHDENEGEKDEGEENGGSEDDPQYEVERIKSHKWTKDGVLQYKVKWLGWDTDGDTSEPEENLESAKLKVDEYLKSLPPKAREEFERKTGRKIGSPTKGKKRRISETIPNVTAKTEKVEEKKIKKEENEKAKEEKEKKIKKEENEKGKEEKEKKKEGKEKGKAKKDMTDFFKTSSGVPKVSKSGSEKTKKGEKSKSFTSSTLTVKTETFDLEGSLKKMEETRKKAFEYSTDDHIGSVIQKAVEALMNMMKHDLNPEKLAVSNETLKNERQLALKRDVVEEKTSDPLRGMAYTVVEKLEGALDVLIEKEIKDRKEIKKEGEGEVSPKEVKEDEKEKEGLFAVSEAGVQGVEVKEEKEEEQRVQVKAEA